MKSKFLTLALICSAFLAKAQGHYAGQSSIGANYLFTENGNAYNLNYQKLVGNNYFGYRADLTYTDRKDNLKVVVAEEVPHQLYSIGVSGTYSLEKIIPYPIYVQLFAGPQYTYEVLNDNKGEDSKGVPYENPKNHTFGLNGGAEIEGALAKNFSIIATSLNYFLIDSEVRKFSPTYGIGIKYNF